MQLKDITCKYCSEKLKLNHFEIGNLSGVKCSFCSNRYSNYDLFSIIKEIDRQNTILNNTCVNFEKRAEERGKSIRKNAGKLSQARQKIKRLENKLIKYEKYDLDDLDTACDQIMKQKMIIKEKNAELEKVYKEFNEYLVVGKQMEAEIGKLKEELQMKKDTRERNFKHYEDLKEKYEALKTALIIVCKDI